MGLNFSHKITRAKCIVVNLKYVYIKLYHTFCRVCKAFQVIVVLQDLMEVKGKMVQLAQWSVMSLYDVSNKLSV